MDKKGQISLFIVLGIIILIIISSFLLFRGKVVKEELLLEEELFPFVAPVKNFVESCLEKTAKEGLLEVAEQGGVYRFVEPYKEESGFKLPYYFYDNENKMPAKEIIEKEFGDYIEEQIVACVGDFTVFNPEGYVIDDDEPSATVNIVPGSVNVQLRYEIGINKEGVQAELNQFTYTIPYDFDEKINIISHFIHEQEDDPEYLPLSYLIDLAEEHDFTFEMVYFSDTTVGFNLLFTDSELYKPFMYSFALKYPEFEEEPEPVVLNDMVPDVIPEMDRFTVRKGETFVYQVPLISGENVKFYDFTHLFDVDENTGNIQFDTKNIERGEYEITIQAIDELGQSDIKELRIEVV